MDILRTFLIYTHLLVFAFAITTLYRSDMNLFFRKISQEKLRMLGDQMLWLLVVLAITGAGIVYIDTEFRYDAIMQADKLLAKMVCVGVLTLNAMVLHHVVFRKMAKAELTHGDMLLMSVSGAVSTCSWTFAGFLGVAKAFTKYFSFEHFLYLYGACLAVAIVVAIMLAPVIKRNWENNVVKNPLMPGAGAVR